MISLIIAGASLDKLSVPPILIARSTLCLRLGNVPNAVGETIAGDVTRLLVVFPGIERVPFVSPLLAAIVARDDAVVAHLHRVGRSHQGRPIAGAWAIAG